MARHNDNKHIGKRHGNVMSGSKRAAPVIPNVEPADPAPTPSKSAAPPPSNTPPPPVSTPSKPPTQSAPPPPVVTKSTTTKAPPPTTPSPTTTSTSSTTSSTTSSPPASPTTTSSTTSSIATTPAVVPVVVPTLSTTDVPIIPTTVLPTTQLYTPPFALTTGLGATNSALDAIPSPSETPTGSSNTGSIVGIVAASIAGVAVVIGLVSFLIRRKLKRGRSNDDFDRDDYMRNSMLINEDMAEKPVMGTNAALAIAKHNMNAGPGPSRTPRPPSSIERHVANSQQQHHLPPMPSMQYDPHSPDMSGPPMQAGDYFNPGYATYGQPGYNGHPDEYQQPGRNLTSVTPYQQQQYAEISRQLDFSEGHNYPASNELNRQPSGGHHEYAQQGFAYEPNSYENNSFLPSVGGTDGPFGDEKDIGRTGTPTDHNPQQARRAPQGGYPELTSALTTPSRANFVRVPETAPHRAEVGLVPPHGGKRLSVVDDDDVYGGI